MFKTLIKIQNSLKISNFKLKIFNAVELMGIAPMSKIDNPKSSTSLVCFNLVRAHIVRSRQNLYMSFPEVVYFRRPENRPKLFP